jgi:hypothetical protein
MRHEPGVRRRCVRRVPGPRIWKHTMKPVRNLKYLAWIRTLPCLICGRTGGVEAAHTGPHGMAQKSADTSAVPLCARHHRTGCDSYHKLGARAFEGRHRVDLRVIAERLNERPSIRIENGSFVGRFGSEELVLGYVGIGVPSAIHRILSFKRADREWQARGDMVEPNITEFLRIRNRLREMP